MMRQYNISYNNILATQVLLKKIKDYIESDFYMDFSPPEECSSEEYYVYGIQDELISLYNKILKEYADETQYILMDNRELFD